MRASMLLILLSAVAATWSAPINPQWRLIPKMTREKRGAKTRGLLNGRYLCDLDQNLCKLEPGWIPRYCTEICEDKGASPYSLLYKIKGVTRRERNKITTGVYPTDANSLLRLWVIPGMQWTSQNTSSTHMAHTYAIGQRDDMEQFKSKYF